MTLARSPLPGVVYPPRETLDHYIGQGVLGRTSLAEALIEALGAHADRVALAGPEGEISYAELDRRSDQYAAALLRLGLRPLDRIIFQLVNSNEIVIALIACWKANLIPVCTLAAHRAKEIEFLAELSGARGYIFGIESKFDFASFARSVQAKVPSLEHLIVGRGQAEGAFHQLDLLADDEDAAEAKKCVNTIDRDPFQVTVFQLSGGTTSVPKIIPRFSNEYLYNMQAVAEWHSYGPNDAIFMPLQFIHNAAMACFVFPALLNGATVLVSPTNDPATLFSMFQIYRPTILVVAGALLSSFQTSDAAPMADLSQVRVVFSLNTAPQTENILGVTGAHIFGMTEGLIMFGRPDDPDEIRLQTVGRPISEWDDVKIVEPGTEDELPAGSLGEMISKGPYTFHGYYKAEERNREVFTPNGYYRSGDLMIAHDFGGTLFYSFEGRIKDLVSRGGEKINCEEVEHAARRHPAISDIAIVAMPDPDYDERACAFVIPTAGTSSPTTTELAEFLVKEGLAKFKCPERIETIDEFPTTDSGKLSKPLLRERIVQLLQSERTA